MEKEQIDKILTQEIGSDFIKKDEPMKKHTSFKIGGNADFFVTAKNEEILKTTLKIAKKYDIPLTVIGNGTNLLVSDNGIRGITLKMALEDIKIKKEKENAAITLGAGVKNAVLAQMLLKQEIAGFEFAAGIPGTIGGAVYMNAGAYGGEMKDIVKKVTYVDFSDLKNDSIKQNYEEENISNRKLVTYTISNQECEFDYRHSIFEENEFIITKVKLELPYGKKEEIQAKMEENAISRKTKQPLMFPSAGSTFKRGKDFITAKLIDECGLKGYHVGDAEVSELHAGFVVNKGNATAKDVMELIGHVQKTVYEKCGKQIELEVKVIGEKL